MRKLLLNTAIFTAIASVSFAGQAAESASLSITGAITPSACNVTLSNASVDFGNITAATLNQNYNAKTASNISVYVDCDAPSAIAIQTTDNRTASAMTKEEATSQLSMQVGGTSDENYFGLGLDGAQSKVGVMFLSVVAATADGAANNHLLISTDKAAWTEVAISSSVNALLEKQGYFALGSDANSSTPAAYTKSTYTLHPIILLKKSNFYPTGEDIKVDGNVTFSVVYL